MKTRYFLSHVLCIAATSLMVASPTFADSELDGGLGGSDGAWGWKPPHHDRFGSSDGNGSGHMFREDDDYGNGSGGGGGFGGGRGLARGPFGGGGIAGGNSLIPLLIALLGGQRSMPGNGLFPGLNGGYPGGNNNFGQGNLFGVLGATPTPTATPTHTPTPTPTATPSQTPTPRATAQGTRF